VALHPAAACAGDNVDLLLVLAADVSRSIDAAKFQLQREGYAAAISDRAYSTHPSGKKRPHRPDICRVVGRWRPACGDRLDHGRDAAAAKDFGDRLIERRGRLPTAPRSAAPSNSRWASSPSPFRVCPPYHRTFPATAPTMPAATSVRCATKPSPRGVTINRSGHPQRQSDVVEPDHTNPPGGLDNYYRNNVIGGPGAFVMVAQNFNSFGQAIINKMIAEVARVREPKPLHSASLLTQSWRPSAR